MENYHQSAGTIDEETQPVSLRKRGGRRVLRWFIVAITAIVFIATVIALAIPSLAKPPADVSDPYEFYSLSDSSEVLDPASDHLVESADLRVAVYIPQGADLGAGQFLILERTTDFIPARIEPGVKRVYAIDLVILRPDGSLEGNLSFTSSLLLCFQLLDQEQEGLAQGDLELRVQRYSESQAGAAWESLDPSPGWQDHQVCSSLQHLSLYALSVFEIGFEETSTPEMATPTPGSKEIPEIYAFPTSSP